MDGAIEKIKMAAVFQNGRNLYKAHIKDVQ